jgi:probable rRNA maturation factor
MAFLTAHGMLHLLGYDHADPAEAAEMERLQEEILESVGIERKR